MVRYTDSMCYHRIKAVVKGFYYQQPKKRKKEKGLDMQIYFLGVNS